MLASLGVIAGVFHLVPKGIVAVAVLLGIAKVNPLVSVRGEPRTAYFDGVKFHGSSLLCHHSSVTCQMAEITPAITQTSRRNAHVMSDAFLMLSIFRIYFSFARTQQVPSSATSYKL
jgi:hypothetical protein